MRCGVKINDLSTPSMRPQLLVYATRTRRLRGLEVTGNPSRSPSKTPTRNPSKNPTGMASRNTGRRQQPRRPKPIIELNGTAGHRGTGSAAFTFNSGVGPLSDMPAVSGLRGPETPLGCSDHGDCGKHVMPSRGYLSFHDMAREYQTIL